MHKETENNSRGAFAGESQAHVRYLIFADRAESEGFPTVARLFRAASFSEQMHAKNHLRVLGGVTKTADHLATAVGGEGYEVDEMYPAYIAVAELQDEKSAARADKWAFEAEKVHGKLYGQALEAVRAGTDATLGPLYVCSSCGWTGEGEPPDVCPICGSKKEKFVIFA